MLYSVVLDTAWETDVVGVRWHNISDLVGPYTPVIQFTAT